VQVTSRGKTSTSDLTNYLASADPLTRPNHIAGGVVERGNDPCAINAAVADKEPVSVPRIEVSARNHSGIGSANRCAACRAEISAVVQLPDFEDWMKSHPKGRGHRACNRVEEALSSGASSCTEACPQGRRRSSCTPGVSFPPHGVSLCRWYQPKVAAVVSHQQQGVQVLASFPQPPVQASVDLGIAAVPATGKHTDHLTQGHPITAVQCADYRLVRGAYAAMVEADHRLARNRSDERHRATGGRENCVPVFGGKINTAMTWSKGSRRRNEAAPHRR
jgi:hypothetical protein